jgi:hypothetical protein
VGKSGARTIRWALMARKISSQTTLAHILKKFKKLSFWRGTAIRNGVIRD